MMPVQTSCSRGILMTDPQRELYRRWGLWRYAWWRLFTSAGCKLIEPGVYAGLRWSMARCCLFLGGLAKP